MKMTDRLYCTAADYARATGYDRSTVLDWIKTGAVRAIKDRKPRAHHRIFYKYFKPEYLVRFAKPDPRHKKWWTPAELYILRGNMDADAAALAALLPHRTATAIKVKRKRERRKE